MTANYTALFLSLYSIINPDSHTNPYAQILRISLLELPPLCGFNEGDVRKAPSLLRYVEVGNDTEYPSY